MKLPSNYCIKPWNSVLQKSEAETVARNIMAILNRTGNTWRELSFVEYEKERLKDGNYSSIEQQYFNEVIGYCKSPGTAILFSDSWKEV